MKCQVLISGKIIKKKTKKNHITKLLSAELAKREVLQMSTNSICFCGKVRKISVCFS